MSTYMTMMGMGLGPEGIRAKRDRQLHIRKQYQLCRRAIAAIALAVPDLETSHQLFHQFLYNENNSDKLVSFIKAIPNWLEKQTNLLDEQKELFEIVHGMCITAKTDDQEKSLSLESEENKIIQKAAELIISIVNNEHYSAELKDICIHTLRWFFNAIHQLKSSNNAWHTEANKFLDEIDKSLKDQTLYEFSPEERILRLAILFCENNKGEFGEKAEPIGDQLDKEVLEPHVLYCKHNRKIEAEHKDMIAHVVSEFSLTNSESVKHEDINETINVTAHALTTVIPRHRPRDPVKIFKFQFIIV